MEQLPDLSKSPIISVLAALYDGAIVAEPARWQIVYANPQVLGWVGGVAEELRRQPLENIFSPRTGASVLQQLNDLWGGSGDQATTSAELRSNDGTFEPIELRACRISCDPQPLVVLILHRTSRAEARRDPLTGVLDRTFLLDRLETLLGGERTADRQFAVLFVDLDNFKHVNDQHGHLIGDRVLREVGQRLTSCVREGDHVARFGGDEFVVLVERVRGRDEVEPVIQRIDAALTRPIELPEGEFTLSLSIGVAVASPAHLSAEDLLNDADRAMYAAKHAAE